jgi:predicted RNA-binding Zn-ribbon protein involved in translation (DUF1610 family)
MLTRAFLVCDKCGWNTEYGNVFWGLIELKIVSTPPTVKPMCPTCRRSFEQKETNEEKYYCPECETVLSKTVRTMKNDNAPDIMGTPYKTPIHSDALALTPANVAEHKERFPDIEIDKQNRPVFTNTKQHQDYLDKIGARKQIQKTGKSKGKIYSYPGSKCS